MILDSDPLIFSMAATGYVIGRNKDKKTERVDRAKAGKAADQ